MASSDQHIAESLVDEGVVFPGGWDFFCELFGYGEGLFEEKILEEGEIFGA